MLLRAHLQRSVMLRDLANLGREHTAGHLRRHALPGAELASSGHVLTFSSHIKMWTYLCSTHGARSAAMRRRDVCWSVRCVHRQTHLCHGDTSAGAEAFILYLQQTTTQ